MFLGFCEFANINHSCNYLVIFPKQVHTGTLLFRSCHCIQWHCHTPRTLISQLSFRRMFAGFCRVSININAIFSRVDEECCDREGAGVIIILSWHTFGGGEETEHNTILSLLLYTHACGARIEDVPDLDAPHSPHASVAHHERSTYQYNRLYYNNNWLS